MKTYILTVDDTQEEVIRALAKALKLDIEIITENDEDTSILKAMEEGKRYGRLTEDESNSFIKGLGE